LRVRATCPTNTILLGFITRTILSYVIINLCLFPNIWTLPPFQMNCYQTL
jgi:hypothetical protein